MSAKMKTLEEQHQDYQRHIAVLKESLCAKEEHYNMLQADVSYQYFKAFMLQFSIFNNYNFEKQIKQNYLYLFTYPALNT